MKNPALTYCTNVHPLQNYGVWTKSIPFFGQRIGALSGRSPLPMGLWFNETVLDAVVSRGAEALRRDLDLWGITTFTLNAFPQGDFHQSEVKKKVYRPDWSEPSRLRYTRRCAELLAALLPDSRDFGSISSLPLGWREGWTGGKSETATAALLELARFLRSLRDSTGKTIALALEPEPGCVLERTVQVLEFWDRILRPAAAKAGISDLLDTHIGVCYDTCHQAVQFEDPEEALSSLYRAGIPIHKMQLSSALEFPPDPAGHSTAARREFAEPKFLHQTRIRTPQGVQAFDDLPEALAADPGLSAHPWRVHYHVPIHADGLLENPAVRTTRADMLRALAYALAHGLTSHFEVETYTWSVLPEAHRPANDEALAQCLAKELAFIRREARGVFDHV